MDKKKALQSKITENGAKRKKVYGFEFFKINNPQVFLEWVTLNGYAMHGSTKKIKGELLPKEANDLIKESGNRKAIYMTINPLLAEFTALTGGMNIDGRQNRCYLKITKNKINYPKEPEFQVGKPSAVAGKGYVYIFDRETQVDEEVGGELLSYKPILPLMVIEIERADFKLPIRKLIK